MEHALPDRSAEAGSREPSRGRGAVSGGDVGEALPARRRLPLDAQQRVHPASVAAGQSPRTAAGRLQPTLGCGRAENEKSDAVRPVAATRPHRVARNQQD